MNQDNDWAFPMNSQANSLDDEGFAEQRESTVSYAVPIHGGETEGESPEPIKNITDEDVSEEVLESPPTTEEVSAPASYLDDCSNEPMEKTFAGFSAVFEALERIEAAQKKNSGVLREMDRKYHNEFNNVITKQQIELDMFREGLGRNVLNGILKTVANLYSDYENLLQLDDIEKVKKGLDALLAEMLQLLHENGVEEHKSKIGERYSLRNCKTFDKIKTGEAELHCTVIESRNTGFYIDKTVLVPERVKIYVYDESYTENNHQTITEVN